MQTGLRMVLLTARLIEQIRVDKPALLQVFRDRTELGGRCRHFWYTVR